jgi:hypothetical protein
VTSLSVTFYQIIGARGSIVVKVLSYKLEGRGFETLWGEILNLPNPSGLLALGFTQPLTEMSTGNIKNKLMFLGSKVWPVRGADNFTSIFEPIA